MIQTNAELDNFLHTIADSEVLAIDTEFLRVDTYYAKACLIQISDGNNAVAIDTLSDINLTPLFAVMFKKLLIFHSGRQDVELLYQLSGTLPKKIFDTQIFAHFLGYIHQVSYGNLVRDILGVELDKAYSNYNWSKRPLPEAVMQYALDDVIYLYQLYETFKHSPWFDFALEDACALLDETLYQVDSTGSYTYLKGYGKLADEALSRAVQLCAYREEQAMAQNKPRKWILSDDEVLKMARTGSIPADIVAQLTPLPVPELQNKVPTLEERNQVKKYQKLFKNKANEYNLPVELFASKKQILKFIRGDASVLFNTGWRRQLLQLKETYE